MSKTNKGPETFFLSVTSWFYTVAFIYTLCVVFKQPCLLVPLRKQHIMSILSYFLRTHKVASMHCFLSGTRICILLRSTMLTLFRHESKQFSFGKKMRMLREWLSHCQLQKQVFQKQSDVYTQVIYVFASLQLFCVIVMDKILCL